MAKNFHEKEQTLRDIATLGAALNESGALNGPAPVKSLRLGVDFGYKKELRHLQIELVKFQQWVRHKGLRVVVVFEGRDAAGKGGAIKRITKCLNPRTCRVVALTAPTEREKSQWYFQRYVAHLSGAGEIVFFDRSWYNRAGVEHVMGFCTEAEYMEFLHTCPQFERMLVCSGIHWKLSPMDLESRRRWVDYSRAKDEMFAHTDIKQAPWYVVNADNKKCARRNVISHLLSMIPYEDLTPEPITLPPADRRNYIRPPIADQTFAPEIYKPPPKSKRLNVAD